MSRREGVGTQRRRPHGLPSDSALPFWPAVSPTVTASASIA